MVVKYHVLGDLVDILESSESTGGVQTLTRVTVQPGGGPPPHMHSRENELFYILEGEITFHVGGERFVCGPGESAFGPIGVPHAFKNESDRVATMLVAMTPGGFEHFFAECDRRFKPGEQWDMGEVVSVIESYGMTVLQPA